MLGANLFSALFMRNREKAVQDATTPEISGQSSGLMSHVGGTRRAEAEAKSEPVEIDSMNVRVIPGPLR